MYEWHCDTLSKHVLRPEMVCIILRSTAIERALQHAQLSVMRSVFTADTVDVALQQAEIQRIVHDFHLSTIIEHASGTRRTELLLPRVYDLGAFLGAFTRYYLKRPPGANCAITEGNMKACKRLFIMRNIERVDCETLSVRSSTLYNHLLSQDTSAYGFSVERIRGSIGTGANTVADIRRKYVYR